jgi:hypothetical protein
VTESRRHTQASLIVQAQAIFPQQHSASHFMLLSTHFFPLSSTEL